MNARMLSGFLVGGVVAIGVSAYQTLSPVEAYGFPILGGWELTPEVTALVWAFVGFLVMQFVPEGRLKDTLLGWIDERDGEFDAETIREAIERTTEYMEFLKALYEKLKRDNATEAELSAVRALAAKQLEQELSASFGKEKSLEA